MRRALVVVVVLVGLAVIPASASAYFVPSVTYNLATKYGKSILRKYHASWGFRDRGYIDCRGGQIDRTHWRCSAAWQEGNHCWIATTVTTGVYAQNGINHYTSYLRHERNGRCV